jgi:hypothetical protein
MAPELHDLRVVLLFEKLPACETGAKPSKLVAIQVADKAVDEMRVGRRARLDAMAPQLIQNVQLVPD